MTPPDGRPEDPAKGPASEAGLENFFGKAAPKVFSDTLELPPEAWAEYLDRVCASEEALRRDVESLLRAHVRGASFLHQPLQVISPGAVLTEFFREAAVGFRVGTYRVLRLLAAGGMGAVYLGERVDEAFQKQVAIKLIRAGHLGSDAILRFRLERQVLADLEHPGIARLIDGGSTDDGLPYLVMEYVDGIPINRYCQEHGLDVPARLGLFLEVCDAVQYAHQNLVIHRDLKPSNILVDRAGRVKLLDFGIAKVLATTEAADGADLTATSFQPLTPRYASPEQVLGHRMTTATDVYSLGVILYELLTYDFPYELESKPPSEVARTISDEVPTRPSRRVAPALSRRLTGDLDTIALKALQKEPARRFATVEDLAADIQRHLAGLPVRARPDTASYRVSKFVTLHRTLVGSIAAVILMLASALIVTLGAYQQATSAKHGAEQQAYMASLVAAESSLLTNQIAEAAAHLDAAPVRLRSWEWNHLRSRLDRSLGTFRAHPKGITRVAFLPDGRRILTASIEGVLKVWSGMSGELEQQYGPFTSEVESVAFIAGSESIAVGLNDGSVVLVNPADGTSRDLASSGSQWAFLSASPDGSRLACGSFDGRIRIWEMPSGVLLTEWKAHAGLTFPAYSPDGRLLATSGGEGIVTLYDARSLERIQDLRGHTRRVYFMAFSPDGSKLATGSMDQTAVVWDVRKHTLLRTFREHRATVGAIAFHPAGDRVATAGADNRLLLWSITTGEVLGEFRGHSADVTALAARPDGSGVISGDWEGIVKSWDWNTQDVRTLKVCGDWIVAQVYQAAWNPDETLLACGTNRGDLPAVNRAGEWVQTYQPRAIIRRVAFDPSGSIVVAASDSGDVLLFHAADSTAFRSVRAHRATILGLAVQARGDRIATASADSTVKLWTFPDITLLWSAAGHRGAVTDVEFSPEGDMLASSGVDGTIRLWDPTSGSSFGVLQADDAAVDDIDFESRGARLAAVSRDGKLWIWNHRDRRLKAALMSRRAAMRAVAWSEDGTRIAAAGSDAIIHIFDPIEGREVMGLHGHVAGITSLRFGHDDATLTSTSLDGTVKIWDQGTGAGILSETFTSPRRPN